MTGGQTLTFLCAGALILGVIAVLAFLIFGASAFSYRKKAEGANTSLTVTAKRNLNRVSVVAHAGEEEITFERKRIRKGQNIEFVYPSSKTPAKLTVEVESGSVRVVEV